MVIVTGYHLIGYMAAPISTGSYQTQYQDIWDNSLLYTWLNDEYFASQ